MNEDDQASVGYTFMSKGLAVKFLSVANTSMPQLYDTLTFDNLELPYQFALAIAYDTGEQTIITVIVKILLFFI